MFHFDRRSGFWILRSNWYHILCQCLNDHVLTIGRLNLCQFHGFPIASTLSHISVIIPSWPTGITQIHVIKYIDPLIDSQLYYCCNWFHIIFIKISMCVSIFLNLYVRIINISTLITIVLLTFLLNNYHAFCYRPHNPHPTYTPPSLNQRRNHFVLYHWSNMIHLGCWHSNM